LDLKVDTTSVTASLVPRLWAAEYARRLMGSAAGSDESRSQILQLGVEYGLVTPYTSSLALEDESAYARQGITRRRSRLRGVRLTAIERPGDEERLVNGILLPGAPPAAVMGCSRSSSATSEREEANDGVFAKSAGGQNAPTSIATAPPMADPMPAASAAPVGDMAGSRDTPTGGPSDNELAPTPTATARPMAKAAPAPPMPAQKVAAAPVAPTAHFRPTTEDKNRAARADEKTVFATSATSHRPAVLRALSLCSDVASRPLAERTLLWQKRAKKVASGAELAGIYDRAYAACELPDWRDEAALLDILGRRIETEQTAETFLAHLAPWPEAQRFVARNLLRRTVDVRIAAAVSRVLHGGVDWARVDNEIASTDKVDRQLLVLKTAMLAAPNDPQGDMRYVRLLARAGQRNEAIAHGRRLRDRGLMTPTLAQQLGDVLADAGEAEEALRTYSEIVEFDGQSREARRVLGDIYLRQGWHAAAYRQYKTLTDLDPKNPLAWLRLANAAAGAGRVDEALHIEREVAGGEGTPGPDDPRVFARMLSAARLAALLEKPDPASGATPEAIGRKLKELSLFSGPGSLALLTWDDLDAKLVLGAADEKKETLAGEATDAGAVGLYAVLGGPDAWERSARAVRQRGDLLPRAVRFRLVVLSWDGTKFHVATKEGQLDAGAKQRAL
ncbi:MAG: tetratricopeptide repeat protein, partial [Labilithrix sp.]|nr:tetratricopeptide repeat protein [Labilithrix sp.]